MWWRRRCVVCGRHVRRSDWRSPRVWAPNRWYAAHRECVTVSDGQLARFLGRAR